MSDLISLIKEKCGGFSDLPAVKSCVEKYINSSDIPDKFKKEVISDYLPLFRFKNCKAVYNGWDCKSKFIDVRTNKSRISEGSYGTIYLSKTKDDDRIIIKESKGIEELYSIYREIFYTVRCAGPFVVPAFSFNFSKRKVEYTMLKARGDLTKLFDAPDSLKIELTIKILKGLSRIHDRGVVHRDLKPENIFVTYDNYPLFGDFGFAISRDDVDKPELGTSMIGDA
jgi:hypothetical protein